jgi:small subunit ribosomal protein S20
MAVKGAIVRRSAALNAVSVLRPELPVMANIHSQKKRILRSERERLENRLYTSTIKTYFRKLEGLVESGDSAEASSAHRELVSTIDKAVKRGAMHKNTGARKKSRAARTLAKAGASGADSASS